MEALTMVNSHHMIACDTVRVSPISPKNRVASLIERQGEEGMAQRINSLSFIGQSRTTAMSGCCAMALAWAHPAHGQSESNEAAVEEAAPDTGVIVVTATKTGEQALTDVPAAITAFSSEELTGRGIEGLGDIQAAAPNMTMGRATNSSILTIRGIGSSNIFIGSDPSSTVHIDGVYIARPNMTLGDFVDIERIEVLRGPQGTLYGRNAVGGTVNIITRMPGDEPTGRLSVEYGSYDLLRATAAISGPVIEDILSVGVSGLISRRDGYVENIAPNVGDLADEEIEAIRGAIRLTPTNSVTVDITADYMRMGDTGPTYKPTYVNVDGSPAAVMPQFIDDFRTVNIPNEQINVIDTYGIGATINWELDPDITLTSITGYRGLDQEWVIDVDFSEFDEWLQSFWDNQEQFSQEINISGSTGSFDWVAGLYYFNEQIDFDLDFQPRFLWGVLPDLHVFIDSDLETNAYAAFAQTDIALTDQLSATLGLRYSYEKKRFNTFGRAQVPPDGPIIPIPGYPFRRDNDTQSWDALTPRLGLDYDFTDDVLAYVSVTRGFKSGGFNITGTEPAYNPETIWAYEVGLKATLFEGLAQLNTAAFYYDYKDIQVQAFTPQGTLDITNAASSTIIGLELEATATPVEGLELYFAGSYLDATYDEYVTARATAPNVPLDLSGNRLNFAPEWMFTFAGTYEFPISDSLQGWIQADVRWQDRVFFSAFNDRVFGQAPYALINAQIGLRTTDDRWTFTAYARNLTNKDYTVGAYDFSVTGVSQFITEPRVLGIRAQYQF